MKPHGPLTAADLLQVGYWFQREGCLFEICAWDAKEPLLVQARAADTQIVQFFTVTELFAPTPPTQFAPTAAELATTPTSSVLETGAIIDAAQLPTHLLQRADAIIRIVETVQATLAQMEQTCLLTSQPFARTIATQQACHTLPTPIAPGTYYKYRHLYHTHHGDRGRMAAALRRNTYGKTALDVNAQHFIDTIIRRFYRSNPPLRAQTVYTIAQQLWRHNCHWWLNLAQIDPQEAEALIERLLDGRQAVDSLLSDPAQVHHLVQIQLPSRTWFYTYVRWFSAQPGDGAQTYIARQGRAEWEANFLVFDRFAQNATLPLQYVCADHYKLDLLHVDDEFREVLGRLWLTVLIDAFSRAILGLYLSYEDPSIESIQGALRHAIWPKTHLEEWGIEQPWSCFGIPQRLSLDNAWAHHSYSLEELARALCAGGHYTQMELLFRPPYQARYGGLVERLFGNFSAHLRERLPGAILRPDQRRWHNPQQGACLLYRDVQRLVYQMVVDYLHTPHRELDGLTPHEKWLRGLQLMTPVPPPLTPHLERCFWRLHPDTRVATRSGFGLFGLHYWDIGLARLRGRDRQGRRRHFHLRYDPTDMSRVAVFEQGMWLGDGYARELHLADGRYEPVSLWELRMAKELGRQRRQEQPPSPHAWLLHILETRELIAQRQAEQKQIRRKVQQLREKRRGRPATPSPDQRQVVEEAQRQATQEVLATVRPSDDEVRIRLLTTLQEVL